MIIYSANGFQVAAAAHHPLAVTGIPHGPLNHRSTLRRFFKSNFFDFHLPVSSWKPLAAQGGAIACPQNAVANEFDPTRQLVTDLGSVVASRPALPPSACNILERRAAVRPRPPGASRSHVPSCQRHCRLLQHRRQPTAIFRTPARALRHCHHPPRRRCSTRKQGFYIIICII